MIYGYLSRKGDFVKYFLLFFRAVGTSLGLVCSRSSFAIFARSLTTDLFEAWIEILSLFFWSIFEMWGFVGHEREYIEKERNSYYFFVFLIRFWHNRET